ncbi:MAG: type II secretion system protein, partial [Desulfobacterales bacterium]
RFLASDTIGMSIPSEKGFTLVEIIAVLVILSVLAAVAIPRYISIDERARQRAIDAGIAELNGREVLTWSNIKITVTGYVDDATLFSQVSTTLGDDYTWDGGAPTDSGGTLKFKESISVPLTRTASEDTHPASWTR